MLYLLFETKDIMPFTDAKKAQLAAVLVDLMAVHPSYTTASVELTVVASSPDGRRRLQVLLPSGAVKVASAAVWLGHHQSANCALHSDAAGHPQRPHPGEGRVQAHHPGRP